MQVLRDLKDPRARWGRPDPREIPAKPLSNRSEHKCRRCQTIGPSRTALMGAPDYSEAKQTVLAGPLSSKPSSGSTAASILGGEGLFLLGMTVMTRAQGDGRFRVAEGASAFVGRRSNASAEALPSSSAVQTKPFRFSPHHRLVRGFGKASKLRRRQQPLRGA
jgi:hypothetical protein